MRTEDKKALAGICPAGMDPFGDPKKLFEQMPLKQRHFVDTRIWAGRPLDLSGLSRADAAAVIVYVEHCDRLPRSVLTVTHYGPWNDEHQLNLSDDLLYRIGVHYGLVSVPLPPIIQDTDDLTQTVFHLGHVIGICGYAAVAMMATGDQQDLVQTVCDLLRESGRTEAVVEAVMFSNRARFFET